MRSDFLNKDELLKREKLERKLIQKEKKL